jgi:hypothetical protein
MVPFHLIHVNINIWGGKPFWAFGSRACASSTLKIKNYICSFLKSMKQNPKSR